MSMTKAELMNVFRDAASAEFADFSPYESDYNYEFSERFERRMDRLIRSESRAAWRFVNTNPKRLIILIVAVIMALTAAACAVPEIRESIAGFFVRMFSDHAEIGLSETIRESIEDSYELDPVPDGFSLSLKKATEFYVYLEYIDSNGNLIILDQKAVHDSPISFDNCSGAYCERSINGKSVLIQFTDNFTQAYWEEEGYLFQLWYSSSVDAETFSTWIDSVKLR